MSKPPEQDLPPFSQLDPGQVIKQSYDEARRRIRVDTEVQAYFDGEQQVSIDASEDSIKIGDGEGDYLAINDDGSINVVVVSGTDPEVISQFNEVSSVASGILTSLLTYTVSSGDTVFLQRIDVSGENIAMYEIYKNASVIARKRTYFGNSLNLTFDFSSNAGKGYKLIAGDNVQVKVLHNRPDVGDFEARLQGMLT